jgi:cytoskeletal protein CcmA (bactofilin family)
MATAAAPQAATIGEGAAFSGKVRGHSLTVLGTVEGEMQLEGRLHVGVSGRVNAKVRAGEVVVEGQIDGEVTAAALTLTETARARGTFVAKRLVVREGATVEGAFNPGTPGSEAKPGDETMPVEKPEAPKPIGPIASGGSPGSGSPGGGSSSGGSGGSGSPSSGSAGGGSSTGGGTSTGGGASTAKTE